MPDHELAMLVYLRLAAVSQERGQLPGRGRFLVLAGAEACRAGWPEIADRCRQLVLSDNPVHLIGRFESFADALRHPDFAPFLKRLERFCPYERAELLLDQLDLPTDRDPDITAGETARNLLDQCKAP